MDLADVRDALAGITITDLDPYPFIPDSISPPTLAVGRMQIDYDQTFGGLEQAVVTLHVFASRADSQEGQATLLPFMAGTGASSIKAALEADRTLDGACDTLRVESCEGPGLVDVGGIQFWSSSWTVRVWG